MQGIEKVKQLTTRRRGGGSWRGKFVSRGHLGTRTIKFLK